MAEIGLMTFRVSGLGHNLTLQINSDATVADLKTEIGSQTGIPSAYQRLLTRGIKLEDNELTLADAGLKDRTKIMLIHNALYAEEKDSFEALEALQKEIEELAAKGSDVDTAAKRELVTQICCKLDGVDTKGSERLRSFRKDLIGKAESIESGST